MSILKKQRRTRAQESSSAIERMYITMRHLFNRGFYKPMGVSGETLREALLILRPEIYGSIAEEKVELDGLLYVIDRLPERIEECRFINLTSDEGYKNSLFEPIIPRKRRRNCYRIDEEQMNIEVTRGRSEIYDILTHLTFLFIESHKIMNRVLINDRGDLTRDWEKLEKAVLSDDEFTQKEREVAPLFNTKNNTRRFLEIIYWLGKLAIAEMTQDEKRTVTFSPVLRERLGHHIHGEIWAQNIKKTLKENDLIHKPIHIISANMHSVMNTIYAPVALKNELKKGSKLDVYELLSDAKSGKLRSKVEKGHLSNGLCLWRTSV